MKTTLATLITASVLVVTPAAAFADTPGDPCSFTDEAGQVVEGTVDDSLECVSADGRSSWGRSSWGRSSWGR